MLEPASTTEDTTAPGKMHHGLPKGLRKAFRSSARRLNDFIQNLDDTALKTMLVPDRPGYCYAVQTDGGAVKIGSARNPAKRLVHLQIASPTPLWFIALFPGGITLEKKLHREFAADRIRGEWYYPSWRLYDRLKDLADAAKIAGIDGAVAKTVLDPKYAGRDFTIDVY